MLKSILLGLDDSAGTERATELGFALPTTHGATVVGLTIINEPDVTAGAAMGIGGATFKHDRDRALLEDARRRVRELEERFSVQCRRAAVSARVLEIAGRPAEAILSEMESHDLVLLGRDANFRFETESADKRTWDVVRHGPTKPVIVVPENDLLGAAPPCSRTTAASPRREA